MRQYEDLVRSFLASGAEETKVPEAEDRPTYTTAADVCTGIRWEIRRQNAHRIIAVRRKGDGVHLYRRIHPLGVGHRPRGWAGETVEAFVRSGEERQTMTTEGDDSAAMYASLHRQVKRRGYDITVSREGRYVHLIRGRVTRGPVPGSYRDTMADFVRSGARRRRIEHDPHRSVHDTAAGYRMVKRHYPADYVGVTVTVKDGALYLMRDDGTQSNEEVCANPLTSER